MPNRNRIDLRRTAAHLEQKKLFLILHEPGTLGEYLAWMRRLLEHNNADLEPMESGPAIAEVQRAIVMRATARKKNADYNEVWCAFNRSERADLNEAKALAESKGIRLTICDPNVDLWFLLHFEDVSAPQPEAELARRLASHFDKDLTSLRHQENRLFGKYDVARDRAITIGTESPGSDLHRLIDAMRASKMAFMGHSDTPKL
ncbi:MAG: RloB domain-containing protein [Salinibacterium sp.]|nr:RloB domain-containing protein [Salinibacterium sp.]